ncbi:MAG: type II secretion system protein GspM [Nitrospinales bacterium]
MIKNLNPRDKKALAFGGSAVLAYAFFVFVAKPVFLKNKDIDQQIRSKILFIKKYYDILNQKAYYEQKLKASKDIQTALSRRFLTPEKPALAAASLQKILEGYAQQTAVNIESARIEKPKYVQQLLAVPVEINIRSNLRDLARFIYLIENHQKFMVVEEMAARRVNNKGLEELQTRLLVLGFIRKLVKTPAKKT